MLSHLRPALVMIAVLTLLTGIAYPVAMTGLAGVLFPHQAEGSLILRNNTIIGSSLIGQAFTKPEYFHPRPSATTDTDPNDATKTIPAPYNAANSAGSNLAPTAKALADRVKDDIAKLKAENPNTPIPGDLVTTSASGLDPHISPEAANFQIKRIAAARNIPEATLAALVAQHTEGRWFGLLGEPRVNVLELNLALDTK